MKRTVLNVSGNALDAVEIFGQVLQLAAKLAQTADILMVSGFGCLTPFPRKTRLQFSPLRLSKYKLKVLKVQLCFYE